MKKESCEKKKAVKNNRKCVYAYFLVSSVLIGDSSCLDWRKGLTKLGTNSSLVALFLMVFSSSLIITL